MRKDKEAMTNSPNTVTDLLTIIAPPLRLISWLELVFENKRKKGEDVPENFVNENGGLGVRFPCL